MSKRTNYDDYGKMIVRASRQVGKSTFHLAQLFNWLSFRDHPQDFRPLEFKMELVSIKEADK